MIFKSYFLKVCIKNRLQGGYSRDRESERIMHKSNKRNNVLIFECKNPDNIYITQC